MSTEPNSGLNDFRNFETGDSGWADEMVSNMLRIGRVGFHILVKDKDLQEPDTTVAFSDGDTYIVASGASGDWAGQDNNIAVWDATESAWTFYAPREGWRVAVEDEEVDYRYALDSGTGWVKQPTALTDGSVAVEGDLAVDTDTMFVDSTNGRVGIGTTSPIAPLSVSAVVGISDGGTSPAFVVDASSSETLTTETFPHITYINQDQTDNNLIKVGFSDSASGGSLVASMEITITSHANNYGQYSFWTRGASGFTEKLTIEEDGNVGIGNSSPSEKLDVDGNVKADVHLLGSYTVGTVPSAASSTGGMIYVSDETGGAVPAFSDGTDWRRVTDRAIVS